MPLGGLVPEDEERGGHAWGEFAGPGELRGSGGKACGNLQIICIYIFYFLRTIELGFRPGSTEMEADDEEEQCGLSIHSAGLRLVDVHSSVCLFVVSVLVAFRKSTFSCLYMQHL